MASKPILLGKGCAEGSVEWYVQVHVILRYNLQKVMPFYAVGKHCWHHTTQHSPICGGGIGIQGKIGIMLEIGIFMWVRVLSTWLPIIHIKWSYWYMVFLFCNLLFVLLSDIKVNTVKENKICVKILWALPDISIYIVQLRYEY